MKLTKLTFLAVMALGCVPALAQVAAPPATTTKPKSINDPTVPAAKDYNEKAHEGFVARHEGFMKDKEALLKNGPIQFVLIGDSITDGWRDGGRDAFKAAFGKFNPYNIGIGGDRTQEVLWRIEKGELDGIDPNPKVAMIMIGTNNLGGATEEQIAAGVTKIVDQVKQKLPKTRILLLAIFPRAEKADHPSRAKIKAINETISKLDDGGKTVKYLDIGAKFLDADGTLPKDIMPDFLHPNAKGYQIWADAVKDTLEEMMK